MKKLAARELAMFRASVAALEQFEREASEARLRYPGQEALIDRLLTQRLAEFRTSVATTAAQSHWADDQQPSMIINIRT